jgi:hypothetical protein
MEENLDYYIPYIKEYFNKIIYYLNQILIKIPIITPTPELNESILLETITTLIDRFYIQMTKYCYKTISLKIEEYFNLFEKSNELDEYINLIYIEAKELNIYYKYLK